MDINYDRLEAWSEFNLASSLKASFSLPLFENPKPNTFVKIYGYGAGLIFKTEKDATYYSGCSLNDALLLSGAWFNPLENVKKLGRREAAYIYEFWEVFPGLSIAVNPWDLRAMFYSIFLSRNTSYHVNTVRWLHHMTVKAGDEGKLASLDPRVFGRSYQLAQLAEIKPNLDGILNSITPGLELVKSKDVFSRIKAKLLQLPYVGSKTVHAFGLFCLGLTWLAPADRHLMTAAKSMGIMGDRVKMPKKELCMRYDCFANSDKCPKFEVCLTAKLMRDFGVMAGWLQTATYLYGALYLSRGLDPVGILKR
ncbi:hypothetical protein KEJ27_06870 [Candidatus Bathyarchaeota archaeon]|nr:hypothetical protein [Candidatus Bathyarchaeota archaeon]MBS7617302.1 hypothetical protein [Candidatus Bathyarchaeota archaeon]